MGKSAAVSTIPQTFKQVDHIQSAAYPIGVQQPYLTMIIDAHAHTMRHVQGQSGKGPTRSLAYGKVKRGTNKVLRMLPPMCQGTSFPAEVLLENLDWTGVDKAVLLQGSF